MLSRRRRPSSRKARLPSPSECINPMSCSTTSSRIDRRGRESELFGDGGRARGAELHEQHQDLGLAGGELDLGDAGGGRRRLRRGRHLDGEHGAAAEVVLRGQDAAQELERLAGEGQPGPDAADDLPLVGGRGGEAGEERTVLVVHPRAVVGDADRLTVVEDGDDDVAEVRVQEVLDDLLEDRVRHLAALLAAVVVGLLRQRGDEGGEVLLLDGDHARRTGERVVDRDAGGLEAERDRGEWAVGSGAGGGVRRGRGGGSPRRGLPGGGPLIGEQPVEERLHRGAEYSRAPGKPPWRLMKRGFAGERRKLSTACSRFVESDPAGPPGNAQFAAVVETAVSGGLDGGTPLRGVRTCRHAVCQPHSCGTRERILRCKTALSADECRVSGVSRQHFVVNALSTAIVSLRA